MAKQLELSRFEVNQRLLLFLKLRKGKTINEQTVKDFDKLLDKMWFNFKCHDDETISKYWLEDYQIKFSALKAIRSGFIKWKGGGNSKLTDIDDFSFYQDQKYRAKIKGELKEISEYDFLTLQYVVFGER
jgi:hypothetical protein